MSTKWFERKFCAVCQVRLQQVEVYYSDGVCPYCGARAIGTIVETVSRICRHTSPWWKFWRREYECDDNTIDGVLNAPADFNIEAPRNRAKNRRNSGGLI